MKPGFLACDLHFERGFCSHADWTLTWPHWSFLLCKVTCSQFQGLQFGHLGHEHNLTFPHQLTTCGIQPPGQSWMLEGKHLSGWRPSPGKPAQDDTGHEVWRGSTWNSLAPLTGKSIGQPGRAWPGDWRANEQWGQQVLQPPPQGCLKGDFM